MVTSAVLLFGVVVACGLVLWLWVQTRRGRLGFALVGVGIALLLFATILLLGGVT